MSVAIGRPVSPAMVRLINAGREYIDDGVTLARCTEMKPLVYISFGPQLNPAWEISTLNQASREQIRNSSTPAVAILASAPAATDALVAAAEEKTNCNIYSLALTMEQIHLPNEADKRSEVGHLLRSAAKGLLNALPTCKKALDDVQRLLLNENSRSDLLSIISSPDGTFSPNVSIRKAAVMRYLVEALCILVLPAHNP